MPQNKIIGIYKITSPTNRIYIGQSINIKKRFLSYKRMNCLGQSSILNSLRKYGPEAHTFEIIQECLVEELDCLEIYYIDFYKTLDKRYGMNCIRGENRLTPRKETYKKLSNALIGNTHLKGYKWSSESIAKRTASLKERYKEGLVNSMKGKKHSAKSLLKMSQIKKGKTFSENTKEKMRINGKNQPPPSLEQRLKISETLKRKYKAKEIKIQKPPLNTRLIIDICTGIYFDSVMDAAYYNNIKPNTLYNNLRGKHKAKHNLIYA